MNKQKKTYLCAILDIHMLKPNNFSHRIAKELLQSMPLTHFEGEVIVVDKMKQVPQAVAYLSQFDVLGVDTEARPSFKRGVHYPTALLQIATHERCYLFRLTHIGMPPLLASLFANESICKVGLAFKDDLHGLRRRRNFVPKNCVDIQSLVNQYGILELGLQKIFAICFAKKISKAQQLTNWEASKLTTEQALYASTDAWATLLIYKELKATKLLPKKVTEALKREDIERQRQHQLEVMQSKCNNTYDNHSTQA